MYDSLIPNLVYFSLDGKAVKPGERQTDEQTDPAIEGEKCIPVGFLYLLDRPLHGGGIGNTPVRGHRLAGPYRANLFGSVVTNRENEIERGSFRTSELLPAFAAETSGGHMCALELRERGRTHGS